MKYIFFNDLQTIKKSMKTIIIYWCILIFSYLILYNFEFDITNTEKYIFLLGLDFNFNDIISISFNVFNIVIYFILTVKLFTKDIIFGNANLFLRMNLLKWVGLKNLMLFFIIAVLKVITHILIGLLCNVTPMYLLSDILFTILFSNFFIVVFIVLKNNILVLSSVVIFFYLCYSFKLSVINISAIYHYIILGIIFEISLVLLFRKEILKLFKEGTDENRS